MAKHTRKRIASSTPQQAAVPSMPSHIQAPQQLATRLLKPQEAYGYRSSNKRRYFYMFLLIVAAAALIYYIMSRCGKSKKEGMSSSASEILTYY